MAVLTSTDLGGAGRYVNFGSPGALNNLGAQTIIVYARPVSSGVNQLFFTKAGTSSSGCLMWIDHNSGNPRFVVGASSTGTAGNPNTSGTPLTGKVVYGQWQHYQMTWDGTISGTSLASFVDDVSAQSASAHYAGTGSVANDASNRLYLMNRQELDRSFTGDFAYFAIWSRVLNATERATVRADGPLSVPDGLVLVYANQSDLGPNKLAISARTTYVAGALPPNTALGGGVTSSASIDATTENATFSGAASGYVPAAGATISTVTDDSVFSGSVRVSPRFTVSVTTDDAIFSGSASVSGIVWPAESDVRLGVAYGPTGTEYTGMMTGGTVDVDAIAAAVLAALQGTTIPVDVTKINHVTLTGAGTAANPMRPA